jgi:hypothetical protein
MAPKRTAGPILVPRAQLEFSLTLWDNCGESRRLIYSEQMWAVPARR